MGTALAAAGLSVLLLTGCVAFGYSIFSGAEVEIVDYGTYQAYDLYFAQIDYVITNTGSTHIGSCEITFKVTCADGSVFRDVWSSENIDPGDSTTGQALVETEGSAIVDVGVTDTKRFGI